VLDDLRRRPDIKGFTTSIDDPVAFRGWYLSEAGWIDDDIALIFVDRPGRAEDQDSETAKLALTVKAMIAHMYLQEGAPQEELWCTAEQIYLF
jgi:hypothetical protein